jgi:hypothetical protein
VDPSRAMERWGERSGRSPLLPPTPPLSWALKPASIASLHHPNRSSSHAFSSQIYLEEVSAILAALDDLRKAPFSLPPCGNAVDVVPPRKGRESPQPWGSFSSPFLSAQIAACVRSLTPSRWKALPR